MKRSDAAGRVVVVGGGAAGLVAAIAAARAGARVTVLERMARVGRKLLATGNGRCNLANARLSADRYHGERPGFPAAALAAFGLAETLAFFEELGIEPREEEGGKIFPRSGQAASVLDVLRLEAEALGVATRCDAAATALRRDRRGAWEVEATGGTLRAAAVVLASGGRAAPHLGANGSGYDLLRPLGHTVVDPFPALTRIRVRSPWLRHLKGVKVVGTATLVSGDPAGPAAAATGEILFTETGLSGPPILDLSRGAGAALRRGAPCALVLDLVPELTGATLAAKLATRFARRPASPAETALLGFVNRRLIVPLLRESRAADPAAPAATVRTAALPALAALLKSWRFAVTGTDSWKEAQVTAGGVATSEVDPATLASLRAAALFLAGEVLDVDGDCGGFNLQWAWSSGHVAGRGAAATACAAGPA